MPHAFKASEIERRAQDGGRASRAWRWFSAATIEASEHFRDWSWLRLTVHGVLALSLIAVSRIDPSWAVAPWMLIAGVAWLVWGVRAAVLKLIDQRA